MHRNKMLTLKSAHVLDESHSEDFVKSHEDVRRSYSFGENDGFVQEEEDQKEFL